MVGGWWLIDVRERWEDSTDTQEVKALRHGEVVGKENSERDLVESVAKAALQPSVKGQKW
jgi:hypothetical protein